MAYLGNAPARSFISFERQVFTIVNSQTAYTLDHSVNNENDIRLVINNIVQEPGSGKAYTASGTTLTLSAALTNGTDEMYCVFLGRATATNAPAAGSVNTAAITDLNVTTAKIAADAITEAKIADDAVESEHLNDNVISGQTELASAPASTDELLISDAGTLKRIDVSLVGGNNTPIFSAYKASDQTSLAANQYNKITFTTEEFDADSAYDASNSKFVAPSAGKYFFSTLMRVYPSSGVVGMSPGFYKNGSLVRYNRQYNEDSQSVEHQIIMDLAQNDYVEVYLYVHTYTSTVSGGQNSNIFQGFKLIS